MKITRQYIEAKMAQAKFDNSKPDAEGNNLMFGVRQKCINPTILNARRERLGYNPKFASAFHQCQPKRLYY